MSEIAKLYASGQMSGWAGEEVAKEQWDLLKSSSTFKPMTLSRAAGSRRMMLYEAVRVVLGQDTPNYPQEIGDPFRAGTMVTMADGTEKAIENLKVGDSVVNHKNEVARVSRVIKKKYTGDMVTVKLKGWHRKLTATAAHHGMYLPFQGKRFKFSGCERIKFGDLQVGDYMMIPNGLETNEEKTIDLATLLLDCEVGINQVSRPTCKHQVKRFIPIDNRLARFIGLYLAEGGCSASGQVSFSFHANETLFIEEVKALLAELFGLEGKCHKTGCDNCVRVCVSSPILGDFLKAYVGHGTGRKFIPADFFRAKRSVRLDVLRAWLDGDGCVVPGKHAALGFTTSSQLGNDMLRLAVSCHISPRSWIRMRKERARNAVTEMGLYGQETWKVYPEHSGALAVKSKKITCNDTPWGFARKITDIKRETVVDEEVYCITTENEFTAVFNGIAQYQCVSFGAKNACEYLECTEIVIKKDSEKFRKVFPPYLYGTGRVQIGRGQLGNQDGSLGSWMAEAVVKYGILAADEGGVPAYSGSVAKQWGYKGPPSNFLEIGKQHPVRSAAKINSWDELVAAICNGYPCTVASNQGFSMQPGRDGFHSPSDTWAHQMCIILA